MKLLVLISLLFVSSNALATKARLNALNNSAHIVDSQTIFSAPLDLLEQPNYLNLEAGLQTPTSSDDNAEGLLSYSLTEKSRLALSIGHVESTVQSSRDFMNSVLGASTYTTSQNPLHLFYAVKQSDDFAYAAGIVYSNYKDKLNNLTESSQSAIVGFQFGSFQLYNSFALVNSLEAAGNKKFDGSGLWNFNLLYGFDTYTFSLFRSSYKSKSSTSGVEDQSHEVVVTELAFVNSNKIEKNDFFYGVTLNQTDVKDRLFDHTLKRTSLPVHMGFEVQASDLMTLRGSLSQTVLIAQSKEEVTTGTAYPAGTIDGATGAASDFANEENNTTAAMGVGLKFKNLTIDATLTGLVGSTQNQKINSTDLLSQVGLVYNY